MTGWRQAVFLRQRRADVIHRALASVLDDESWSPATPRRLRIGAADASSHGWTMIVPELANFFLDPGGRDGAAEPRLCRLARELRCPAYQVDLRDRVTLCEADEHGQLRVSGAALPVMARLGAAGGALDGRSEASPVGVEPDAAGATGRAGGKAPRGAALASPEVGFGLLALPQEIGDRIAALGAGPPAALADYLGALAGFPAWTHLADDPITAAELIYEPPPILARGTGTQFPLEPRAPAARAPARTGAPTFDRRNRRPRSAARPRR